MATVENSSAIFNSIPESYPVLNETIVCKTGTIDLDSVPLDGGILTKTLYLSIDPYQRGRMVAPRSESDAVAYELGEPLPGYAIVSVLRSEKEGIRRGDTLFVPDYPFREYSILPPTHAVRVINKEPEIPLSAYIGVLGMPGQTAFYGLEVIGKPVEGETIYVSAGASTVGALVIQLAKAKGLKVISSAGSDDKVAFLKSIGADVAFNYKTESVSDALSKNGPIDIFWDNVGGPTLEAALDALSTGGRVVICGAISDYNLKEGYGIKNTPMILWKRLKVEGLFIFWAEEVYEGQLNNPLKFLEAVVPLVKSGQIKFLEQVFHGIEGVGEAAVAVLTGNSTGKAIIKVADI